MLRRKRNIRKVPIRSWSALDLRASITPYDIISNATRTNYGPSTHYTYISGTHTIEQRPSAINYKTYNLTPLRHSFGAPHQ
eukprot:3832041-Pyramimonas_sp.AAC.1